MDVNCGPAVDCEAADRPPDVVSFKAARAANRGEAVCARTYAFAA